MSYSELSKQIGAYKLARETVGKTRQIVLLYETVLSNVHQAKQAIEDRRIEDRYNLIQKASDIVTGLQDCLDFNSGGNIASQLYDFYADLFSELSFIQSNNDAPACDRVIAKLKDMLGVWRAIDEKHEHSASAPSMPQQAAATEQSSIHISA